MRAGLEERHGGDDSADGYVSGDNKLPCKGGIPTSFRINESLGQRM